MTDPLDERAMQDGPNTHKYDDVGFVTEWAVLSLEQLTDDGPVTHRFHVPARLLREYAALSPTPEPDLRAALDKYTDTIATFSEGGGSFQQMTVLDGNHVELVGPREAALVRLIRASLANTEPVSPDPRTACVFCGSPSGEPCGGGDIINPGCPRRTEPVSPGYCAIHQHYKWCQHNGGVMGDTGYTAPVSPGSAS